MNGADTLGTDVGLLDSMPMYMKMCKSFDDILNTCCNDKYTTTQNLQIIVNNYLPSSN